ncbi:basic helix-loop-helix (bHLH) DNA-binding superfamily protein isoform X1 [Carex rostrata]
MAQEGSEASVTSSTTNSWWQEIQHHASTTPQTVPNIPWTGSTISRWSQMPHPQQQCEGDLSVSHHATSLTGSGLTIDSTSPVETTHLWSQVLLSTGGGARNMHQQDHEDSANFLDLLNSKNLAHDMFDLPACDYLKKMDTTTAANTSWEFASASSMSLNPLPNYSSNPNPNPTEPGLGHLSDLVSNWSIAPPNTNPNILAPPNQCNNTTIFPSKAGNSCLDANHVSLIKHENPNVPSYGNNAVISDGGVDYQDFGSPVSSFLRSCQLGMNNNPVLGLNNKLCNGLMEAPWCNNGTRSLTDIISFSGSLNKPTTDLKRFKTCVQGPDTAESRKPRPESPARTNSRGSGTSSEGKKKRSEENSEAAQAKKSKQETSTTSSPKQVQVPKVKMAEKITALQQIVSPFGKTDTASVLLEAINYIKFLHEHVQLLSDPYMKAGANKDCNAWGAMDRKEKSEASQDLRSRGLCLVPVSCTPQVYRDSNIPDYWTPPYRSSLYR